MKIEKFEDIIAWQKGKKLTLNVYAMFKNCKDFSFKNQIERAAVSIMNNVAEGFERKTNKDRPLGQIMPTSQLITICTYIHEQGFRCFKSQI